MQSLHRHTPTGTLSVGCNKLGLYPVWPAAVDGKGSCVVPVGPAAGVLLCMLCGCGQLCARVFTAGFFVFRAGSFGRAVLWCALAAALW
jgi:hypothetical protein